MKCEFVILPLRAHTTQVFKDKHCADIAPISSIKPTSKDMLMLTISCANRLT